MASYDDTATVSGSVVSFSDGADEVGLKSCVVSLPASLSGYSEVNAVRSGKNLLDTAIAETKTNNSVSITCDGNGKYTATGTATGGSANITFTLKTPCTIKSGMYLHLMNGSANANVSITLQKQDNTTIYAPALSPANRIADLSSYAGQTIYSIRFYVVNGASFEMTLTPMICFSSTATAYEAYEAPTQYTASLGRTIYGGTPDIVSGTGTETHKKAVFDGSSDENWTLAATGTYRYGFLSNNYIENNSMYTSILCDTITVKNTSENNDDGITCRGTSYASRRFYVFIPIDNDLGITDVTTFKAWLANNPCTIIYPPTTGSEMTFQKVDIQTSKGSNTFWSDQGDSEVTYYKEGYGTTSVTIHKETPEGEPVEQTAKLHRVIYGGLVDVISGKAEPKNLIPFEPISEDTYLGVTYTQYSDGTVKINGTASGGLSFYRVIPNGSDGVHFKSGVAYTLSGCVGGSSTTYQLDLRVGNSVVGYYKNAIDYGRGYTFTATEDAVAYPLICVRNGTTVNNVIISPMVEVGSSASEYVPHFDPFSFPPISMETDEGENTLYADEGDSAIVYRKAVE